MEFGCLVEVSVNCWGFSPKAGEHAGENTQQFRSYIQFEIQISNGLHFCFVFPVHQFSGLKCSLKSCPGWYRRESFNDTWQMHCLQKSVEDTSCGSPGRGAHCLFHWINYGNLEKEGVGRELPNSHSPSLNSIENNLSWNELLLQKWKCHVHSPLLVNCQLL